MIGEFSLFMKNKIVGVIFLVLVIVGLVLVFSGNKIEKTVSEEYMDVSAQEAKQLIDNNPNLVIIDVSPFYGDGHIPGAVWYYYGDGSLNEAIPTLDKEKSYLVYCHFDGPSISGAQSLVDAGFMVYRLADHFAGWEDAGYDIEI